MVSVKTILIAPHQVTKDQPIPLYGSLGVLALAAALKKNNKSCQIIDLSEYHLIGDKTFSEISEEIFTKISNSAPDIVGYSTISDSLIIALEIAKTVKKRLPNVKNVFGGPGVSYCSESIMKHFPQVDYIIRGEADEVFPVFIESFSNGNPQPELKGLVYIDNGQVIDFGWPDPIKDLDDLPIPAYEYCLDDQNRYLNFDSSFGYVIEAGRGCPYNCNFCSTSDYFNRKFRVKSVERIVEEVNQIKEQSKDRRIILSHDLLTFKADYIRKLGRALSENFPHINWGCNSRLDTIDDELMEVMAKNGFNYIYFGIEVATRKMQKSIGKKLNLEKIDSVLESLNKYNYEFVFSFVVGLPEEDATDIIALFNLVLKSKSVCGDNCLIQIHPLIPELGSRILKDKIQDLEYNEKTGLMDSAIPLHWTKEREIIKKHPDIFARFFSLKYSISDYSNEGSDPFKYSLFAHLAENLMKRSLVYAYMVLGDIYGTTLVSCFDKTGISSADSLAKIDFHELMENIRVSTLGLFEENNYDPEYFNSLIKYEMAFYSVNFHASDEFTKNISVSHTEKEILRPFSDFKLSPFPEGKALNMVMLWDKKIMGVRCIEIAPGFASFFGIG